MYPHFRLFKDSAFGVCPLAFCKFDSNMGRIASYTRRSAARRVSHLVATRIILGLYMAIMSHLVFQEE